MHRHDAPVPQEKHHVWPKEFHGPNTASNLILICCNAHSDIHYFLNYRLKHQGVWPEDWRTYSPKVRQYANEGYDKIMEYGNSLAPL